METFEKIRRLELERSTEKKDFFLRIFLVFGLLYIFLIGVKSLELGIKLLGEDFANSVLLLTDNPFIALIAGILATTLFQSSSITTAMIVGIVSSGGLSLEGAIPVMMGANVGTSVTNTLVSLGHLMSTNDFKKAFSAAIIHDFFNILSVGVLLPLELSTGLLQNLATYLCGFLYGIGDSLAFTSPIKIAITPPVNAMEHLSRSLFTGEPWGPSALILVIAGGLIISSLALIVRVMRVVVENNKKGVIDRLLSQNVLLSIFFGAVTTIAVQSSSLTTSLLIPLAGSGVLSLSAVYPVTVGANIGTTATALLAGLTGNIYGLSIALVHLFFNVLGALIWFFPPLTRRFPIWASLKLAEAVARRKTLALAYIFLVFFVVPFSLIKFGKY